MALEGELEIAISQPIIDETLRVLRKKFNWSEDDLEAAGTLIRGSTHLVHPIQSLHVIADDPSDNRILECAVAAGSEFIVSGDKHLLKAGSHAGIRIIRVSEFLERRYPN